MNYTASHCVRLDENQAGPLSERRSWHVSSSITSQFVYQKINIPKIFKKT